MQHKRLAGAEVANPELDHAVAVFYVAQRLHEGLDFGRAAHRNVLHAQLGHYAAQQRVDDGRGFLGFDVIQHIQAVIFW